jgi:hypothetical protein
MRLSAPRSTRRLLTLPLVAGLIVVGGLPGTARAASTDGPDFEMPFPCGDTWTGSSRSSHSPSALSIDWNRTDDLGAPMMAAAPGVVSKVADLGSRSYGRYVVVDHGGGRSTVYAHLQSIWTSQGQTVDQGTLIGQVGSTGGSTGPHLHFEERLDGTVQRSYFHRTLFTMGRTLSSQMCSDTPVMGDWNGNGTSDIGLLRRTASPQFLGKRAGMPKRVVTYGRGGDQPLAGDWDGDGRSEVGLWNPSSHQFTQRLRTGTLRKFTLGSSGDLPVAADWNGDRRTDVGVFTPSTGTFTLRSVSRAGAVSLSRVDLGGSRSLPVAGDWNADGRGDVGVYTPSTAGFSLRLTPTASSRTAYRTSVWGEPRG